MLYKIACVCVFVCVSVCNPANINTFMVNFKIQIQIKDLYKL